MEENGNSDLNLTLDTGKIHVLLGENGSGKTTFLKMAAGLLRPSHGQILFQGHPLSWQDRAKISWLSTEPIFYDYMRVSDVEQYYADFFPDFDRKRFSSLMQKPGFGDNPKAKDLSSGSGAKLRIAAAVLLFVGLPFAPSMPEWKAFCFLTGTCRTVRAVCSGWFPDPLCRSLAPNILLQSCRRFFPSVFFPLSVFSFRRSLE